METKQERRNRLDRERYALRKLDPEFMEHKREKSRRNYNPETTRIYREKNQETIKEYQKEYHKTEKGISVRVKGNKKYNQTEHGKKYRTIYNWERSGVKHPDFNELYQKYISQTNCEHCNIPFNEDRKLNSWKCLDHDHSTGLFRKILCNNCNSLDNYLNN